MWLFLCWVPRWLTTDGADLTRTLQVALANIVANWPAEVCAAQEIVSPQYEKLVMGQELLMYMRLSDGGAPLQTQERPQEHCAANSMGTTYS